MIRLAVCVRNECLIHGAVGVEACDPESLHAIDIRKITTDEDLSIAQLHDLPDLTLAADDRHERLIRCSVGIELVKGISAERPIRAGQKTAVGQKLDVVYRRH